MRPQTGLGLAVPAKQLVCLCYDVQTAQKTTSNNQTVYTFAPYTYGGGIRDHYELTFVAEAVPSDDQTPCSGPMTRNLNWKLSFDHADH